MAPQATSKFLISKVISNLRNLGNPRIQQLEEKNDGLDFGTKSKMMKTEEPPL